MSDAYGSFGNPYGVPPPFPHQAPPGPPGPPPGPPPGAPLPPPAPYQQPSAWDPWARDPRPAVVAVAAILAIVLCALSILVLLVGVLAVIGAHVAPDTPDDALSTGEMIASLAVIAVALGVSVFALVLAGLALGRRHWARITLVVLGFVTAALLWFIGVCMIIDGVEPRTSTGEVVGGAVFGVLGFLPVFSSVLLLLPRAGRWYGGRRDPATAAAPTPAIG